MKYKGLSRFLALVTIVAFVAIWSFLFIGCEDDSDTGTGSGVVISAWTTEELILEGNHFRAVSFIDEDNGWLVGQGGNIIRTSDGGNSWTQLPGKTMDDLFDVAFFDTDTGWTVGKNGSILYTHNGGQSWRNDLYHYTYETIYSVEYLSSHKLFATGNNATLIFSLDGGQTWNSSSVENNVDIFDISIYDTTAVAVGDSGCIFIGTDFSKIIERLATDTLTDTTWCPDTTVTVIDTIDPPETTFVIDTIPCGIDITFDTLFHALDTVWSEWNTTTSGTSLPLNSVTMVNSTTGWAVGNNGIILNTTDRGVTWTVQADGEFDDDLLKVRFDDASNGWITGTNGIILSTSNGGANWIVQNSNVIFDLYDIAHVASDDFWAVGSLTLLKSTDDGSTWEPNNSGTIPTPSLMDITFVNDSLGFAVGYGAAILRTTNGGDSWEYRRRNPEYYVEEWFTKVQFLNADTGFCVGQHGITPGTGVILKTIDGGETWEKGLIYYGELPDTTLAIEDVFSLDYNHCWIVAGDKILKSTDGGFEWEKMELQTTNDLNGIVFINEETGWAVGMNGTILKTESDSLGWIDLTIDTISTDLYDVTFVNDTTGWAVGKDGIILNTLDSGTTWTEQNSGTSNGLNTVFFKDELTGWVIGYGGTILYTINGGETWTKQPSPTSANLNNIAVSDSTYTDLWIVGENGLILSTTSSGN